MSGIRRQKVLNNLNLNLNLNLKSRLLKLGIIPVAFPYKNLYLYLTNTTGVKSNSLREESHIALRNHIQLLILLFWEKKK